MASFVISKRFSGDYKFEFTSRKGKTIFTSNSYELRMDCEADAEYIRSVFDSCSYVKFKTTKGKFFFRVVVDGVVKAVSRKYTTELMVQKGIDEIVKYGARAEILDFSNNNFVFED
ncbi:DUF1508 domain-containing protein [Flavobacterium muglaense]|uniref:DUF1508 domain-containing protein n=1 Tax=Flavobacterium muglaense TaxID=2764716 RepID=A0A923MYZ6_9FLAO|nr:DUF1508 domain-containing protein [Flavobacterium muglaense]MBC5837206.1 DUF1508 domain-containing protein [Flavobacterium muglaense]MBC5843735.1 DUF1508 domain-containing protein [Flavobacterium muglaense]